MVVVLLIQKEVVTPPLPPVHEGIVRVFELIRLNTRSMSLGSGVYISVAMGPS